MSISGQTCNHVVAALYKMENATSLGYTSPSCTDLPCEWNKQTRRLVAPARICDMPLRKDNRLRDDGEASLRRINSEVKAQFDPRREGDREVDGESLARLLHKWKGVNPKAVIFKGITIDNRIRFLFLVFNGINYNINW